MHGLESQRLEALARANEVRVARATLKKRLARREVTIGAVLAEPSDVALGMPLVELLRAVPGVGKVKATRILRDARVSPSLPLARIGGATRGQIERRLPS